MQLIVNCFVPWQDGFVMLQKPRRGWWYLPGGKVEDHELWRQAAMREFSEESGLQLADASLRGIYRVQVAAGPDSTAKDRIIAQFVGHGPTGTLLKENREGKLAVVKADELAHLPMDEGDRLMVQHTLAAEARGTSVVFFGRFTYDADHQVKSWTIDPDNYLNSV
ncbi:NUDIX domain-containing protein [Alicyclobacillus fastidiosus]|uniref:NUDIX domain-containing protein n=1 Tax=Alicyclobacillus fastidiosus TaxID=392011 RepID=A0ABV5AJF2_9BACL|nr:NUDIX domain-containing protein [Alicyclobacillus fastidiosus]WEH09358.1 NUDIX domain-containing protein [Alicyclobacillus fastidiosus]